MTSTREPRLVLRFAVASLIAFVLVAAGALYLLVRNARERADRDRGRRARRPVRAAPADRVARVPRASTRSVSRATRAHDGLGLSLHLAKELAEQLRGRVDVDSTPGRGSTFTVTVPTNTTSAEPVTVAN